MAAIVGITLALLVSISTSLAGFDRDRAFYPAITVVIASYYVLFAVIGGSSHALVIESIGTAAFFAVAVLGFRRNLWWVVAALFAHGVLDCFHGHLVENPGVPASWPMFCASYDIFASAYLAWLLKRGRVARPRVPIPESCSHEHAAAEAGHRGNGPAGTARS